MGQKKGHFSEVSLFQGLKCSAWGGGGGGMCLFREVIEGFHCTATYTQCFQTNAIECVLFVVCRRDSVWLSGAHRENHHK